MEAANRRGATKEENRDGPKVTLFKHERLIRVTGRAISRALKISERTVFRCLSGVGVQLKTKSLGDSVLG
jgi:hypothetical protein